MKIALVITTYNWKEALEAVLKSVLKQSLLPYEVIIADDGSKKDTIELVEKYKKNFPCTLKHSWQEDKGFRLSESRNKAIALSESDYIILIDGDMVLHKDFILTHIKSSKSNRFVQGGRVLTSKELSIKMLTSNYTPNFLSKGIRNRHNAINNKLLSILFSKAKNSANSTRGCNLAFWREDCIKTNGFDEDFIGWGREDSEFTHRMLNLKKERYYLKFSAVAYHLYHKEASRNCLNENDEILNKTIENKKTRCKNGIDKYL